MLPGKVQRIFWPSPEWKELIWRCHTGKQLSKELAKYNAASLIIGTMTNKPNEYHCSYSSAEQLTNACVLEAQNPAIQFAFCADEDGESLLFEQARNTIELFSFMTTDLEEWMKDSESQLEIVAGRRSRPAIGQW